MRRVLLMVPVLVAAWVSVPAPRSFAAGGCASGGAPPPADVAQRSVGDLDWDEPVVSQLLVREAEALLREADQKPLPVTPR